MERYIYIIEVGDIMLNSNFNENDKIENDNFNLYIYDNDAYLLNSSLVAKTAVDGCGKLA